MNKKKRKKKIAFVLTTFVVGGVEKSFLDLLDCIDKDLYDVTVFLPDDEGEWTPRLKEKCNIQFLKIEDFKTIFFSLISRREFFCLVRSFYYRILAKVFYKKYYRKSTEFFIRSMPRVKEKFDCVVAYQIINDDCVLGSLYRIKAKKKVVWSHAYINKEEKIYWHWYEKFDKIFCVSNFVRGAFVNNFPVLSEKTEVFYNVLNPNRIKTLSEEPIELKFESKAVVIVTVGRLSKEKGQAMIPHATHILLDAGYNIIWYLVGDGDIRKEIICEIKKENVENNVILVGNKNNPYPYIKASDIYVQTSIEEGWGLTVSEAKILQKPIVTTDAGVMAEQIQTGDNGIIIREPSAEALAHGIQRLLDCPELRDKFVRQLQQEDVCHRGEIEKLYRVIE